MNENNRHDRDPEVVRWNLTRREFLKGSGAVIAGLSTGALAAYADEADGSVRLSFGMVTDPHYADTDPRIGRHYRESLAKMAECVGLMNDKQVDFLVEIGDLKDQDEPPVEEATLEYLEAIEEVFGQFDRPRFHVLGNHDVDSISKSQFLDRVENTGIAKDATYYSFDSKGVHFTVLDADYNADGSEYDHGNFDWKDSNIPPQQLDWLAKDLAASSGPVIVFVHQRLDVTNHYGIRNAAAVRKVLQDSKKVLAVFQGHDHPGGYSQIEGIHYYTLAAVVDGAGEERNAYAIADVHADGTIVVNGYRKALSKTLENGSSWNEGQVVWCSGEGSDTGRSRRRKNSV